jgi:O-antigen/teichoic acid export membrane protein
MTNDPLQPSRRFARNVLSSWLGFLVHVAAMVLLTPLVLDALGASRYGVWALLSTLTGYSSLLDAGARASIGRSVARYWALGDRVRMNRVASAGLAALLGCSVVLAAATFLCAALGPSIFRLSNELVGEFRWCALAMGGSVAMQFCFFAHSACLGARQRLDLSMAAHILTQVLYACGTPLILAAGGGLIGLTLWLAATQLLAYVIQWPMTRRVFPELSMSLRLVDRAGLKEFASFGLWQCLVNLSRQIIGASDAIVIALTLSTSAVAPFYVANRVVRCFARFFLPVGVVLFPMLTHLEALGDKEKIRRVCLRGTRLMWVLSLGMAAIAYCWASDFFALWIGESASGLDGRVPDLFNVLLAGAVVTAPQQIALPVFLAFGRQRLVAFLFALEAAAALGLSLALVGRYGLMGIAWGMCLPALVLQGLVHPLLTCRTLDVSIGDYARQILARPIALAAVLVPLAQWRPDATIGGWIALVLAGIGSTLVVVVAAVVIGLDREDRDRFLARPLRKLRTTLPRPHTPATQDAESG